MRTKKEIQASRLNGAKSRGPKTAAGKAISSRDGFRHCLRSGNPIAALGDLLIDPAELSEMTASLIADWKPETPHDRAVLEHRAWRHCYSLRLARREKEILETSMVRLSSGHPTLPVSEVLGLAWVECERLVAVLNRLLAVLNWKAARVNRLQTRDFSLPLKIFRNERTRQAVDSMEVSFPGSAGLTPPAQRCLSASAGPGAPAVASEDRLTNSTADASANSMTDEPGMEHWESPARHSLGGSGSTSPHASKNQNSPNEPGNLFKTQDLALGSTRRPE
jgi:hypothetical protein